jgi:two-component system NtrC family response regulator
MVKQGQFRRDLLFRLQALSLELPPLRERREDIKALVVYHMDKICERHKTGTKGFSPEFFEALIRYSWPGNIRELINTVERVLAVSGDEPTLFPKHLPNYIRIKLARGKSFKGSQAQNTPKTTAESSPTFPPLSTLRETTVAQLEKQYLLDLMVHTKGNAKEACRISGLGKSRYYELLKKYNISFPE